MLGYMTKKQALANGLTHHASYYGIPLWVGDITGNFNVACNWAPMEYLMTAFHYIEGFVRSTMFPEQEPNFQFVIGKPIDETQAKR